MLTWIREKFGTVLIGGIIGFIAFVFVFYGIFTPKSTRGLREGAVAGVVNGDPISIAEFNRGLAQRMEMFKSMGGAGLTPAQLKAFRIKEGVFSELVSRKLMAQEAARLGMIPSDEEVRDKIRAVPNFQKDGKFDPAQYKQILEANNYTATGFEKMVRDDLMMQQWGQYFKDRVHVSDPELKQEFMLSQDKRNIRFVLLTAEAGKKGVHVDPAAIQKFLSDPAKLNLAKSRFESKKRMEQAQDPKNAKKIAEKTFDSEKEGIAREILAGEKLDEVQKINDKLAEEVLPLLTADKSSDAKINSLLKPYGVTVKSTGLINRESKYIPQIGEASELMADAFAEKSPIDPKQGGKAKKYKSAVWSLVAVTSEVQNPDLSKFDSEKDKLIQQLSAQKERALYEGWLQKLNSKAKIEKNESVLGSDSDGDGEGA